MTIEEVKLEGKTVEEHTGFFSNSLDSLRYGACNRFSYDNIQAFKAIELQFLVNFYSNVCCATEVESHEQLPRFQADMERIYQAIRAVVEDVRDQAIENHQAKVN